MTVVLIGDTRTYGKPVGFFPLPVFEYNIFPVSFKTVNSNGEADYFSGFKVDRNIADDLSHDFGDEAEANLNAALKYIETGSLIANAPAKISSLSTSETRVLNELNINFSDHLPAVTIENRPSKMPPWIKALQR